MLLADMSTSDWIRPNEVVLEVFLLYVGGATAFFRDGLHLALLRRTWRNLNVEGWETMLGPVQCLMTLRRYAP